MSDKIIPFDKISSISENLKKQGKKIVHCHGVFDLLHPGHIKHLQAAKKFGDVLIVSITEDKHVNKGPDRPVFNEILRSETLASIEVVDYVTINQHPLAITAIEAIKPSFYVKGQEFKNEKDDVTGGIIVERNKVEEFGGQLVFTEEIVFSSSKLINRHLNYNDQNLKEYLKMIRESLTFDKLKMDFDKISGFKVLIIGDIILDEYQFVEPLGKASKSATITAKSLSGELYAGGVLAVANHVANFVDKVKLVSTYGNNYGRDYYGFIKEKLSKNVHFEGIFTPDRPTVLKKRYIDKIFKHKLFEIIEIEDCPLPSNIQDDIKKALNFENEKYDLAIIADFGHGLIDNELVSYLIRQDIFICVNTQTNSANNGFNLLTKYNRCDYFSIDKNEARLATRDKYSEIHKLLEILLKKTKARLGSITLGVEGSMVKYCNQDGYAISPVLSAEVIDTIGAGDAFLSITSLLAKNGNTPGEIAFVGNAVGAMAVKILGNKSYIEKVPLLKYLKTLLT